MRYLFRGIIRDTGRVVEGHVTAPDEPTAYQALSDNGIVTEALREDPPALNLSRQALPTNEFTEAIESALDSSSAQVDFDALAEKYRGKRVWVIDREKIRTRVAQVVDQAMSQGQQSSETIDEIRARVGEAIKGMFTDNKNIASEVSATNASLEQMIARLSHVVRQAETVMATLAVAGRKMAYGTPARTHVGDIRAEASDEPNHEILLEIFKTNVDLRRSMDQTPGNGAPAAAQSDEKETSN